ncbi:MAG: DegT/DnrJ/EryC1/StrS family aminotransferase [Lentisphaeria bacterium]|nr:DegT/DnrJ/EryC1/StrS family aminotransferase [Lentisphaeria bacterium]
MKVMFLDMKAPYLELKKELDEAYFRFMESGWYVLGPEAENFEKEYAAYTGTKHCVGVSNGLDALTLALRAAGIGPGDEVIVPSNTYIATWLAVSEVGAKIVPAEPELHTFNLDPARMEAAVTPRTRAVIAVHLFGTPAQMDPIMASARKHHLFVLEDNAQSQGAIYHGRRTGNLGDAGAVSFYPGKNIGAFGEAGCVTSDSAELDDAVRVLRNYGSRIKYQNEVIGYNRRIDALQCAFLSVKLKKLDEWNDRRRKIAALYFDGLKDVPGILLPDSALEESVWHQFVIRCGNRDRLREKLSAAGVQTLIHYPVPPHLSGAYASLGFRRGEFPIAEQLADTSISLPIGPHLKPEEAGYVIDCIRRSV